MCCLSRLIWPKQCVSAKNSVSAKTPKPEKTEIPKPNRNLFRLTTKAGGGREEVAVGAVQERGETLRERLQAALPRREGVVQDHLEGAQRQDALPEGEQAAGEDGVGPLPTRPLLRVRHRTLHGVPAPRGAQGTRFNRIRLGFTERGVLSVEGFEDNVLGSSSG